MTGRERDRASLDSLLNSIPEPQQPAGFAARIVRDVTRLPQESAAPAPVALPPAVRPPRRWIAWAGGAGMALAASLAMALLLPEGGERKVAVPLPRATPAPAPAPAREAARAPETTPPDAAVTPAPTAELADSRPSPRSAPSTPYAPKPAPVAATPPAAPLVEEAEATPPAPAANAAQTARTDSVEADDEAELVDGGVGADAPGATARSPNAASPLPRRGWGFAPGAASIQPATPPSDGDAGMDRRRARGRF